MASPDISGLEITSARKFNAPRAAVFAAFADPASLVHWWGPNGFTNRITEFDFRPGGAWRIVMRNSDDVDFDSHSEFLAIEPEVRISYLHLEPIHRFVMTMDYTDVAPGRTQLAWHMRMERTAENKQLQQFIRGAHQENFDRLAGFLRSQGAVGSRTQNRQPATPSDSTPMVPLRRVRILRTVFKPKPKPG